MARKRCKKPGRCNRLRAKKGSAPKAKAKARPKAARRSSWAHINQIHRGKRNYIVNVLRAVSGLDFGISAMADGVEDDGTAWRTAGRGLTISPDGTQAIWYDTTYNMIYGATLSTPWDILTMTRDTERAQWSTNNFGCDVSPDGLNMVQMYTGGFYYGTFSTAWDASALSTGTSQAITGLAALGRGCRFGNDGNHLFVLKSTGFLQKYSLSTAYDPSTFVDTLVEEVELTTPADHGVQSWYDFDFNEDGTRFYASSMQTVHEYRMTTAWDLSTASYSGQQCSHISNVTAVWYDKVNQDNIWIAWGQQLIKWTEHTDNQPAYEDGVLPPVTSWFCDTETVIAKDGFGWGGIYFNDDGTEMYFHNTANTYDRFEQWTLSTPWDVSSGTFTGSVAEGTIGTPSQLRISDDGLILWESDANEIQQWDFGTAWDITTLVYRDTTALVTGTNSGFDFNGDGTKLFVCNQNELFYEYDCSTPYDVSTIGAAVQTIGISTIFPIDSAAPNPNQIWFDADGIRLYMRGAARYIYEMHLTTAWDISTTESVGRRIWLNDSINGFYIDPSNTRMYVVQANKAVKQLGLHGLS